MLGKTLLLLAFPIGGLLAQSSRITVRITSPNRGEFRIVRATDGSAESPLFGRGNVELAAFDTRDASAFPPMEIAAMDTVNNVHVEARRGGRVIASGDGRYVTVRRAESGIAIEARSEAPASVSRGLKRR